MIDSLSPHLYVRLQIGTTCLTLSNMTSLMALDIAPIQDGMSHLRRITVASLQLHIAPVSPLIQIPNPSSTLIVLANEKFKML